MAEGVKPFKVEYAKSGRAACRSCSNNIGKDALRLAKLVESKQFDGMMTLWFHASCAMKKKGFFKSVEDVEGVDSLRWEDQEKLRTYAKGEDVGTAGEEADEEPDPKTSDFSMEYAKSSRSTCKFCSEKIEKDAIRISRLEHSSNGRFSGTFPAWRHAACALEEAILTMPVSEVPGWKTLKKEDQAELLGGTAGKASGSSKGTSSSAPSKAVKALKAAPADAPEEAAPKKKRAKKGAKESEEPVPAPAAAGKRKAAEKKTETPAPAPKKAKAAPASKSKSEPAGQKKTEEPAPAPKKTRAAPAPASKSQSDPAGEESKAKAKGKGKLAADGKADTQLAVKAEAGPGPGSRAAAKGKRPEVDSALQKTLEKQTRQLWELKDGLKKHVTKRELADMLQANKQSASGSEDDLVTRCADGMLFGALSPCPLCSGSLSYFDGQYRCGGFMSEWSKCVFTTRDNLREKGKWKLPTGCENEFLVQWAKKQPSKKEVRTLPPPAAARPSAAPRKLVPSRPAPESEVLLAEGEPSEQPLKGIVCAVVGRLKKSQDEWKEKIEAAGGRLASGVSNATTCVITTEAELQGDNAKLVAARKLHKPFLSEGFLEDSLASGRRAAMSRFQLADGGTRVKVKVKGQSAVHPDSGFEEKGHILEVGGRACNTTLNLSDIASGINSYYILQVIEEDSRHVCHVFRKWGRVGSDSIGGCKVEQMPRAAAIAQFQRLFQEKTGNEWEDPRPYEKRPGKFYPLDIDYGGDGPEGGEDVSRALGEPSSSLDPRVVGLLKMLFDKEKYMMAMREFEIDTSKMPLGKLTKRHIERGFSVLSELQTLLTEEGASAQSRDARLMDVSNRFHTLIPTVHPQCISQLDMLVDKIRMLEALRDMEIASTILNEGAASGQNPLDACYERLQCEIRPLSKDHPDWGMCARYLKKTHAPTHKDWNLEVEDIFYVDRKGEAECYAPVGKALPNRMLLWHGSRTTNFVGILSQGLRIAPPEAPVTGYMFGKGIYFADLVSKSAQYCYTTKTQPQGLMLLSEVALGNMYKLRKAQTMDKPPRGMHSTKGEGKMMPDEKEFETWNKDVVVPSGRPVPSEVKASQLQYNEYIVYDTAQVKLQFLMKVRFEHKR